MPFCVFPLPDKMIPAKSFPLACVLYQLALFFGVCNIFADHAGSCGPERSLHCFFSCKLSHRCAGQCCELFLRALDKVKEITIASVITCLITVSCNLLFLLIFRWGVNGYLLANILGHVLSLLYLMLAARLGRYISFRINDPELTRRIIVFSLPMIVSALSWWINNSLDKYILSFSAASLQPGFWLWPIRFRLLSPPLAQPFPKRIPFRCCKISIQQIRMDSWGKAMRSSAFLWCCVPPP